MTQYSLNPNGNLLNHTEIDMMLHHQFHHTQVLVHITAEADCMLRP